MTYTFNSKLRITKEDVNLPALGDFTVDAPLGTITLTTDKVLTQAQIAVAESKLTNIMGAKMNINPSLIETHVEFYPKDEV